MASDRLDKLLVARKLVETRSKARDLIKRGCVTVAGEVNTKPAAILSPLVEISIAGDEADYVSRGCLKLKAALDAFAFKITEAIALDLGASTGGFCQVLLEAGAHKVYAVDVGHGQLHPRIKKNKKVVCLEGQDARLLTKEHILEDIDIITSDLSFISTTQALSPALTFVKKRAFLICLIKPQFEVGKEGIGKGGIVRDQDLQQQAIMKVKDWVDSQPGWHVQDVIPSPITGQGGNQEYLLGAQYDEC